MMEKSPAPAASSNGIVETPPQQKRMIPTIGGQIPEDNSIKQVFSIIAMCIYLICLFGRDHCGINYTEKIGK